MSDGHATLDGAWIRAAVERFEGPLVLYAARLTGDAERARDVVQEVFLRLCSQPQREVETHLAEWLYTVCRNYALDIRRKERRMIAMNETAEAARSSAPPPDEALERREAAHEALKMLDGLPDDQQEVIRLKFQHGRSYKEIAAITERSISHVGVLIHLGLKTLRARVAESGANAATGKTS
ncbi:MAG: sigma-70 family RNA polymerase sigma factor [Planctomycetota bacterium]|nr:sigma-70 family RNA polymerase sigma factor [Planctomycetota bacterium]